jgi:D-ribose pyranase
MSTYEIIVLIRGILNPAINALLSRVRHTNALIVADRGFPTLPEIEVIDISLVTGIPKVVDVLTALRQEFGFTAIMASEFRDVSAPDVAAAYTQALDGIAITWEPHNDFKSRALGVLGIIRTGDPTRYGNVHLTSA